MEILKWYGIGEGNKQLYIGKLLLHVINKSFSSKIVLALYFLGKRFEYLFFIYVLIKHLGLQDCMVYTS
jgi:hypothetical protein